MSAAGAPKQADKPLRVIVTLGPDVSVNAEAPIQMALSDGCANS